MKVYDVQAVILGTNDEPELRKERVVAGSLAEVHELLARVCRDTMCVIRTVIVSETRSKPFDNLDRQGSPNRRTT